jgi:hypothetical protein
VAEIGTEKVQIFKLIRFTNFMLMNKLNGV